MKRNNLKAETLPLYTNFIYFLLFYHEQQNGWILIFRRKKLDFKITVFSFLYQPLTILNIHLTRHGKGSMRYGCLIPNRSDLGEGVGQGNGLPRIRSTEVKSRVGGWIFYSSKDHHPLCSQAYTKQEFIFESNPWQIYQKIT